MSAGPPPPPLTPAQFLELERNASSKSEYIDGQVFALAGTSERHDVIGVNLLSALHRQLRGSSLSLDEVYERVEGLAIG